MRLGRRVHAVPALADRVFEPARSEHITRRRHRSRSSPALPNLTVEVYGNTIQIRGASQGRTTYRVTLDAGIGDVFGQVLGSPQTRHLRGRLRAAQHGHAGRQLRRARPAGQAGAVGLHDQLHPARRARVRGQAGGLARVQDVPAGALPDRQPAQRCPGQLVYQKTVPIESVADKMVETAVDLDPAFKQAQGHLVVLDQAGADGPARAAPAAQPARRSSRVGAEDTDRAGCIRGRGPDAGLGELAEGRLAAGERRAVALARQRDRAHRRSRHGDAAAARGNAGSAPACEGER